MSQSSRRTFLRDIALTGWAASVAPMVPAQSQEPAASKLPISGTDQPELARFDDMVSAFVREQQVPGAAMAVTAGKRLVYARGFGLGDRERGRPVQPTDLFRIASISKTLTTVAILQLVESARLDVNATVWSVLDLPQPADPRWKAVSIWHLLHHTGGWDDAVFDPMFQAARIARALNTPLPIDQHAIIRYMLGVPLQFDPGERFAYSNFGYCLLGRVIERVTGEPYGQAVQRSVLAPLGIGRMRLGRTLASQRVETEVTYYDEKNRTAAAVVGSIGERVPLPYGAWSLEAMAAPGGWLASAVDLVRFAAAFDDPVNCPILQPKTIGLMVERPQGPAGVEVGGNYPGCAWFVWPRADTPHKAYLSANGQLARSASYLMRRHDGMNWAVLFNTANGIDGKPLMIKFRDRVHTAIDNTRNWPALDQFANLR